MDTIEDRTTFIGPLPQYVVRDPYEFSGVRMGHTKNAREFVLAAAAVMRHRGREVQVEETDESIYAYAPAPRWYDTPVTVHAVKFGQRWKFVGATTLGRNGEAKTYRKASTIINVYGR